MKTVVSVVVLVVVLVLVFIQLRPATFHVERTAVVHAPAAVVYQQIADFHRWQAWSPWEHLDPSMRKDYSGPASGAGAAYHWAGTGKAGEGSMTVTSSVPPSQVTIDLEFIKPFKSSNVTTFTLAPDPAGTKVTWAMDGRNNFFSKAMGLFASMDKMIGPDFERGLAGLDRAAPAAPDSAAAAKPAAE